MIQVNNLSFHYQGVKRNVFSDFNMTLKENNIYGLLGKNGTGKSTLLYLISGLLRQQQGAILIDGISSCDRRPDVLRDIFIVTEEFFLPNVSLDVYVKMNRPFSVSYTHLRTLDGTKEKGLYEFCPCHRYKIPFHGRAHQWP